jgi:hypothetical protein
MSEVAHILSAIEPGEPHAADRLLPLVYGELRKLAAQKLALESRRPLLDADDIARLADRQVASGPK